MVKERNLHRFFCASKVLGIFCRVVDLLYSTVKGAVTVGRLSGDCRVTVG